MSITKRMSSTINDSAGVEMSYDGTVTTLTFANPTQKGALTPEILIGLREQLANAAAAGKRVAVLRGAGETFLAAMPSTVYLAPRNLQSRMRSRKRARRLSLLRWS